MKRFESDSLSSEVVSRMTSVTTSNPGYRDFCSAYALAAAILDFHSSICLAICLNASSPVEGTAV